MTLFVLAVVTAAVLAVVLGGRPSTFGRPVIHRFGLLGIVVIGMATSPLAKSTGVYAGWLIAAAIAVGWFMALNRGRPGLGLAIGGLALNAVVIIVNSGMPVSLAAVDRAGVPLSRVPLDTDPLREELTTETTLSWLGEAVPLALPIRPAVVSPGDVLVAAGGALFLFTGLTGLGRSMPERELTREERKAQRLARKASRAAGIAPGTVGSTPQTASVPGWSDDYMHEAAATTQTPWAGARDGRVGPTRSGRGRARRVEPVEEPAASEPPASGLVTAEMPAPEHPEARSAPPVAPAVGSTDNGAGPPTVADPSTEAEAAAAAAAAAAVAEAERARRHL
ncbi:MAG: DUF5317 family protein, partial [Actinomycetota bacterium]|nr:DUF5317 family protein [Actinomycetota bacterium]